MESSSDRKEEGEEIASATTYFLLFYLFCIIHYLRFPLFLTLPVIQFSLQKVAINQFIYLFIYDSDADDIHGSDNDTENDSEDTESNTQDHRVSV